MQQIEQQPQLEYTEFSHPTKVRTESLGMRITAVSPTQNRAFAILTLSAERVAYSWLKA